jgi:DNA-binding NtrC family response regulator
MNSSPEEIMPSRIVIADDQPEIREALQQTLVATGRDVHACATGVQALNHIRDAPQSVDLAILDLDFGEGEPDGLEILRLLKEQVPDLPVIILTGEGTVETAVNALRLGAADFIEKDFYIEDRLELSVEKLERVLAVADENVKLREEVKDLDRENRFYRDEFGKRYQVIGTSPIMQQLLQKAERVASIPRPVLLLGEPGTGKELVAATIHYGGNRKDRPFVKVNCAALSPTLLESELFGHEKGAFTGAGDARAGKFEAADGGTLFLDEIGNTSAEFQQNILRAIEYQEVQRVGSAAPFKVDVRVIAATNADLEREIAEGRFRQDLYDRLRFEILRIPPLRERREDIQPLAEHFVREMVQEVPGIQERRFSKDAERALMAYDWPGNVRELKFAAERAACIATGDDLILDDLPPEVVSDADTSSDGNFESQLEAFELSLLRRALRSSSWNQRKAASSLGLTYDQFRHFYRKHDLSQEKPAG